MEFRVLGQKPGHWDIMGIGGAATMGRARVQKNRSGNLQLAKQGQTSRTQSSTVGQGRIRRGAMYGLRLYSGAWEDQ